MVRDEFYWLGQINKATILTNGAKGLLKPEIALVASRALREVLASGEDPLNRVKRVIDFEPKLIAAANTSEVTEIHVGRSSQDMHSTFRSAIMRDNLFRVMKALEETLSKLLDLANRHQDTVMPSYTNGVAAQPTSFAHYLSGFIAGFLRDRERLQEFLPRLNRCPMGACVLNGTGWPLDREAMSRYLGFDAPTRNAFDATQISMVDLPVEFAQIQASIALHVGEMIADIMVQYAQPRPWILLAEGNGNTYVSSAMPQKRNPGLLISCRGNASDVISDAEAVVTRSHNVPSGMIDGKSVKIHSALAQATVKTLERFSKILDALVVNKDRALEELNLDWTASQEIADRLMAEYGLPFRVGHHVASGMVSYARANGILPLTFPYEEMKRIYSETVEKEMPGFDTACPMSQAEFQACLDPREILKHRRTKGSANQQEVADMLKEQALSLNHYKDLSTSGLAAVDEAMNKLDTEFDSLK